MPMADNDLTIKIVVDDSGAKDKLRDDDRALDSLGQTAKKTATAVSDYEKQVRTTVQSQQASTTVLGQLQGQLAVAKSSVSALTAAWIEYASAPKIQAELAPQLGAATQQVRELTDQIKALSASTSDAKPKLDALAAGMTAAGRVSADSAKMIAGMSQSGREAAGGLQEASTSGSAFGAMITTITERLLIYASIRGVIRAIESTVQFGLDLERLSAQTGMSVQAIQELNYAAAATGVPMTALTQAVGQLQRKLELEDGGAVKAVEHLGLNFEAIRHMAPEQQFDVVAKALSGVKDQTEFAGLSAELFSSRSGTAIAAVIKNYDELKDKAHESNTILSDEQVAAIAKVATMWETAKLQAQAYFATLIAGEAGPNKFKEVVVPGGIASQTSAGLNRALANEIDAQLKQMAEHPQVAADGGAAAGQAWWTSFNNQFKPGAQAPSFTDDKQGAARYAEAQLAAKELTRTVEEQIAAEKRAATAVNEYAKAWQKNDEEVQKIWGEAFVAQQRIDKDSLTSHLAVLEQQRQNDLNAAANKIADTTKSADQYRQLEFAINAKYDALEHDAEISAVKKVETDKAEVKFTELTSSSAAQMKASQKQFELESKTIGETQKLWIDYYDFEAKKAGDSAGYQIAQVERWLDEKRLAAKNAGIIDQQYYDALLARAKQQIDAFIAGNGLLTGPIPNMLLFKPSMSDIPKATKDLGSFGQELSSIIQNLRAVGSSSESSFARVIKDVELALNAVKTLDKAMKLSGLGSIDPTASAPGGANVGGAAGGLAVAGGGTAVAAATASAVTIVGAWVAVGVAVYAFVSALREANKEAEKLYKIATATKEVLTDFKVSTPFSDALNQQLADTQENFAHITALNTVQKTHNELLQEAHDLGISVIGTNRAMLSDEELAAKINVQSNAAYLAEMAQAAHLSDIIKELGGVSQLTADQLAMVQDRAGKLFDLIKLGGPVAVDAIKTMDDTMIAFTQNLDASGGVVSQFFLDMVNKAHDLGVVLPQVAAFEKGQATALATALSDLFTQPMMANIAATGKAISDAQTALDKANEAIQDTLKTSSKATAVELENQLDAQTALNAAMADQKVQADRNKDALRNLGYEAVLAFNAAIASGSNFMQALQGISGQLGTLQQAYKDLGLSIDDAAIKGLLLENTILNGTTDKPSGLGKAIAGLQAIFTAAQNIPGLMTPDMFKAQQGTLGSLYTQTQAATEQAGGTTINALLPFQQTLHEMQDYAKKNNIALDDKTQQMIDQSKELGIWTDDFKSDSEKTRDSIADLIKSNDALIVALGTNTGAHSGDSSGTGGTTASIGGYVGPTSIRHFAYGGPVGTDTVNAWLTPGESVLTRSATDSIGYGTIAALNSGAMSSGFLKGDQPWNAPWPSAGGSKSFPIDFPNGTGGGIVKNYNITITARNDEAAEKWRDWMRNDGIEVFVEEIEDKRYVSRIKQALV